MKIREVIGIIAIAYCLPLMLGGLFLIAGQSIYINGSLIVYPFVGNIGYITGFSAIIIGIVFMFAGFKILDLI